MCQRFLCEFYINEITRKTSSTIKLFARFYENTKTYRKLPINALLFKRTNVYNKRKKVTKVGLTNIMSNK